MSIAERRAQALKDARALVDQVKADGRDLTPEETGQMNGFVAEVKACDEKLADIKSSQGALTALSTLLDPNALPTGQAQAAKTLGQHFVKSVGARLTELKGVQGASVAAPEFKAATDNQVVGSVFGPLLTTIDQTIISPVRPRLVVADLLGAGTISGNAISYFVEGLMEGVFTTVAEAGAKPQLHFADPTTVTDVLKKIAGFIKLTDEMIEDLPFLVSEIDVRLRYELGRMEEQQLLTGAGTGTTLLGLLLRSGVQQILRGNAASLETAPDAVFRAITAVGTASGLDADGIIINPLDYQAFRLAKDGNGQYYGGGFFAGQYGNSVMQDNPPIWGLRTVVTPAQPQGKAIVGAFSQAATVYRKGGLRVESTNSHASDFTNNLVTIRVEERIALAVRYPSAIAVVTLAVGA